MTNNDFKAKDLSGHNIYYYAARKQIIYYNRFTKQGYVIKNKDASVISYFSLKLPLSIALSSILILLKVNVLLSLVIGILSYIICSVIFYISYLPTLAISKSFKKPISKGFIRDIASRYSVDRLKTLFIMCIVISITMLVNAFINRLNADGITLTVIFVSIPIIAAILILYIVRVKNIENL